MRNNALSLDKTKAHREGVCGGKQCEVMPSQTCDGVDVKESLQRNTANSPDKKRRSVNAYALNTMRR